MMPFFLPVGVEDRGQRPLEALFVHAALGGMNVVGKGDNRFVERVVILQRNLCRLVALPACHVDDVGVNFVSLVPFVIPASTAQRTAS